MNLSELFQALARARIQLALENGSLKVNAPKGAVTADLLAHLKEHKEALMAHLRQPMQATPRIEPADRLQGLKLSFAQQRLWLLDQIDGGGAHYNLTGALKLTGSLDSAALGRALDCVLERHDSLRTCFRLGADGEALQVVQAASAVPLVVNDISGLQGAARQARLDQLRAQEQAQGFDLGADLMLRAQLIKLEHDAHIALVTMHHIAADGWSMAILIREISALYTAFVQGRENPLARPAVQYADYAQWQRNYLQGEVLEQQLGYWTRQLDALPAVHSLPLDFARPEVQSFAGAIHLSTIEPEHSAALQALCQGAGATLFMGVHAAFAVLMARTSNETDIIVGSPIANREQAEIAPLIGFFVNNLVLRSDLSGAPSFNTVLAQSKRLLLEAYAHQQVPFEQIVEKLQPERSLSHSPLFQVMLTMQNNAQASLEMPGLRADTMAEADTSAKYDLTVSVSEQAGGLAIEWQYNTDLFRHASIVRMASRFGVLLDALVAAPYASMLAVDLLTGAERHQVLTEWNQTDTPYPAGLCIHERFEQFASRQPDAVALEFEGCQLSYGELDRRANQMAHYLVRHHGVKPDTLVGLCIERSFEMMVGMLGILKAGGAYMALDPHFPAARLAYMMNDAQPATVLTVCGLLDNLPSGAKAPVCIDSAAVREALAALPDTALPAAAHGVGPQHLSHVIFTSGSTGEPKGIEITHRNVLRLACDSNYVDPALATTIAQFSTTTFDAATMEIWLALLNGARLVMPAPGRMSLAQIAGTITGHGVDTLLLTTAVFNEMVDFQLPALLAARQVMTGGEALSAAHVQRFLAAATSTTLICAYGPSEGTTLASFVALTPELVRRGVPIGKPVANTTLYILDSADNPVPVGVAGELHIGGPGVARGYLDRARLTAEKFIPDPFGEVPGARLYKSGDLARFRPDGNIEFLGRIDHQVKIHGQRIELGEIENALAAMAVVREAVVLAREDVAGDKRLVAYVCMDGDSAFDAAELQQALRSSLPEFMVPAHYVALKQLPMMLNGKIDRKALPRPALETLQVSYVAPLTPADQMLCALWQEVLKIDRIGMSDNFFRLGGHSLTGTRLIARINQVFKVSLPLKALFRSQTVAQLAQELLEHGSGTRRPPLLPVAREAGALPSFAQQRLWLLDQIDGGGSHYNIPLALRLRGTLDRRAFEGALSTILARHESLRTCMIGNAGRLEPRILDAAPLPVAFTDLSALESAPREARLARLSAQEGARGFDLARDLMLRAQLIRMDDSEHVVLVTMHHIAADGWSLSIFIREFCALYGAFAQGQENPLKPLPVQYADYAHWQRNWLQGDVLARQMEYWTAQLRALPVVHSLPLDLPRPQLQSFTGQVFSSRISLATSAALRQLCQAAGATLFMGLHAAFAALLSRYSNETDIVIGTPIANREQAEVASLIGFFVNNLVLRSDLSMQPGFGELLEQSKGVLLDAYAHQQVPFEQIVEHLQPERSLSHSPLFQVMLAWQNNADAAVSMPGLVATPIEEISTVAKYDLTLNAAEDEQGLALDWEFNTDLFSQATITRMARHLEVLLDAMLAEPGRRVADLPMMDAQERQQLLAGWNDTANDYPATLGVHQLFEEQAQRAHGSVAVVHGAEALSYEQLNERSNQLAHYLIARAVGPDVRVGIRLERGIEMIVAVLAVLKAGGAYVPLDPAYPQERLAWMLEDAAPAVVLTQQSLLAGIPGAIFCIDSQWHELVGSSTANPNVAVQGANLAYVMYTSGSTGRPKGVMVRHDSLCNLAMFQAVKLHQLGCRAVLQFASINFDMSVEEIFPALLEGARLVIRPAGVVAPDAEFLQLIDEHQIDAANLPTAFWHEWVNALEHGHSAIPASIRLLAVGGEKVNARQYAQWAQHTHARNGLWVNAYGPTESTVNAATLQLPFGQPCGAFEVPIGTPIANTQIHILDEQFNPVPVGVAGQLYIAGTGLARGYLNRPDLTAEKFIPNPFSATAGALMYQSGDLARYLPGGSIDYLGRADHQVKIRGFRIELGEIEAALRTCAPVADAIVLAREDLPGDKRLVAYVIAREGCSIDSAILETELGASLPSYMVPAQMMVLEQFPLTPNGKIDRKALPAPDLARHGNDYIAPRTPTQVLMAAIWADVLKCERVGLTDNFFQLGGHSLLVMQVIAGLQQAGRSLAVRQLFATPVLQDLAAALDATAESAQFVAPPNAIPAQCDAITPAMLPLVALEAADIANIVARVPGGAANVQDIYPLASLQEGILFHHMMSTQSDPYVLPVLFRIDGDAAVQAFLGALQGVIDRHDVLRTAIFWADLPRPVQVVCRRAPVPVTALALDPATPALAQMQALCEPGKQWIDLAQAPLLQVKLGAEAGSNVRYLLLQYHHIISDHVGMEIIQHEVQEIQAGRAAMLPPQVPYREFVAHALHQAGQHNAETYFRGVLGDVDEPTLPFGLADVQGDGSRVLEVREQVSATLGLRIRQCARHLKLSPASLFHAAWAVVLANCTGRDDVVFGTVLSGRLQGTQGVENMLGMFINTLPVRVKLAGNDALALVRQVQASLQDLLPYEQASLAFAQRCSAVGGGAALFSAVLNYRHSAPEGESAYLAEAGIDCILAQERSNYPFILSVDDYGDAFGLDAQIDAAVDAARLVGYMQTALAALVDALEAASGAPVMAMCVVPDAERHQQLVQWNATVTEHQSRQCVHELFEEHARQRPDTLALVCGEHSLTYGELNSRANQLARHLKARYQLAADSLVGICAERSVAMIVGALAILKAGAAYVPLDPEYPDSRLAFMVDDAGLGVVLTLASLNRHDVIGAARAVFLDDAALMLELQTLPDTNIAGEQSAGDLAQVIYTSGSTGNPKGVMVQHDSIVNLVSNASYISLSPADKMSYAQNVSFDAASFEIWVALTNGATLVNIPTETLIDAPQLEKHLRKHGMDTLVVTTALFNSIANDCPTAFSSLRNVIFGGENASLPAIRKIVEHGKPQRLLNVYGPTENTTITSVMPMDAESVTTPIGAPISNTSAYVVNASGNIVPIGVTGELLVGGANVTRGYLNRPELTAEKFVVNPFHQPGSPASSARLYRTGDQVRWLADGTLEFQGRIDHQVKINGFRIELGEIENCLTGHPLVGSAVVIPVAAAGGVKRLAAYVTLAEPGTVELVREYLVQKLPKYMVPAALMPLEKMPLTPNGKVDHKALPAPQWGRGDADYVAPRNEVERKLAAIWTEVLHADQVGVHDNFFDLGGHSLLATQLSVRIVEHFGRTLSLRLLFESQTLAAMAAAIEAELKLDAKPAMKSITRLSRDAHRVKAQAGDLVVPNTQE